MQTIGAVLHSAFRIAETAAAPVAKRIQRAVAEKAIEILRICALMAGEIFTVPVLKEIVICHR